MYASAARAAIVAICTRSMNSLHVTQSFADFASYASSRKKHMRHNKWVSDGQVCWSSITHVALMNLMHVFMLEDQRSELRTWCL
jgi:hypothetical protein